MKPLSESKIWRGEKSGFYFKIQHWGEDIGINEGAGVWNYYVTIPERRVADFESLWLPPEVVKTTPESRGWVTYKYSESKPAGADWHGGVTFYAKHGEVKGFRSVEFGCDYNHHYDTGCTYSVESIMREVEATIAELNEMYPEPEKTSK